jgi:hypothetical protein
MKKFILIAFLVVAAFLIWDYRNYLAIAPSETSPSPSSTAIASPKTSSSIYDPSRITKKPLGIYVSPNHSPVSPERFAGFHTGTDFETTADEADKDIMVPAFCDGKLLVAKYATGYGGVAVESCTLNGQAVTVIYGHLKVDTITTASTLKKGDPIGLLGKGYSTETDGERKHLHLGIHKGTSVDIRGYASSGELSNWIDPETFLDIPESSTYELHESDKAQTFIYPETSRFMAVLDSTKHSTNGTDCEPHGILGSISDTPAVPAPLFAIRYEGVAAGGCTLQNGDWYVHIIIK